MWGGGGGEMGKRILVLGISIPATHRPVDAIIN